MNTKNGLSKYGVIGGILLIAFFLMNGYEVSEFSFWGLTFNKKGETEVVDPQPLKNPQQTFPDQNQSNTSSQSTVQQPVQPQTTAVTIAYSGDYYGCQLPLNMQIGGVSFVPQGNYYQVGGVPLGVQQYAISGQIMCPAIGSCQASGSGSLDIQPNQTYFVAWQNTTYGGCTVVLSAGF